MVSVHREGYKLIGFTPETPEEDVTMRELFPEASRLGRVMYVEDRFADEVIDILETEGGLDFGRAA